MGKRNFAAVVSGILQALFGRFFDNGNAQAAVFKLAGECQTGGAAANDDDVAVHNSCLALRVEKSLPIVTDAA